MYADKAIGYSYEENEEGKNSYCHNLVEDGHSDWRLPTIDELRVLVQNHPGTVVGGKCKISAPYLPSCRGIEGNNFSKLGDNAELWSSTSDLTPRAAYNKSIDFSNGSFSSGDDYHDSFYIRCVRQEDSDACEAARKEETDEAWQYYLSYFPKGKCAKEAKAGAKEDALWEASVLTVILRRSIRKCAFNAAPAPTFARWARSPWWDKRTKVKFL